MSEIPIEIVHKLQPSGMPPHGLELKIGCVLMILRNLYPKKGFCNGTKCRLVEFQGEWLILEIISDDFKGERTAIDLFAPLYKKLWKQVENRIC